MKPTINIPREKLAELLQASGSTLTPEEYTAALPGTGAFVKFPSRARAAAWSKNILIAAVVVSALFALAAVPDFFHTLRYSFHPDPSPVSDGGDNGVEDVIVLIWLSVVTYFEMRVRRYFLENKPNAPSLGFRNQCCFAAGILIYGLYHAFVPSPMPAQIKELADADTLSMVQGILKAGYLAIGIVGGVSQFALACYYRSARIVE